MRGLQASGFAEYRTWVCRISNVGLQNIERGFAEYRTTI
jgi:hypothetical protein